MGCDKNGTLLLPFSSSQNALSYFNNENYIRKIPRKGNVMKYVENLKVKKARKVWETVTPKKTRSKYNVIFWKKRKCISEN